MIEVVLCNDKNCERDVEYSYLENPNVVEVRVDEPDLWVEPCYKRAFGFVSKVQLVL